MTEDEALPGEEKRRAKIKNAPESRGMEELGEKEAIVSMVRVNF